MKISTRKLLLGLGSAAAVGLAAVCISKAISKTLIEEALDREEPKIMRKAMPLIAGAGSSITPEEEQTALRRREEFRMREHTALCITSFDGTHLIGHLYTVPGAKRLIIAMHGWRSNWSRDFAVISEFWEKNGCSVLYAEQRAQGQSEGAHMGFGLLERFDCLAWTKYVCENIAGDLPVYLAGVSMGATTVLMTVGSEELPQKVKGVIADCGFTSPDDIWKHVVEDNMKISYNLRRREIDALCRRTIGMEASSYSTLDAMKANTRVPILFIHGADDHFVPLQMTVDNYEACAAPKKLLIVQGADHALSYLIEKEKYEAAVLDLFAQCDNL